MKFISRKMFKNGNKNKKGFTLVEIIVVIVIIGMLSAVTYLGYNGVNRQAISATIMTELKDNAGTLKLYNADHGAYPNSIDASYCPNSPKVDTKNCLKAASGYVLEYQGGKQEFVLAEMHVATGIKYIITESSEAFLASGVSSVKIQEGSPSCALSELGQLTCWDRTYAGLNSFAIATAPQSTYSPSALTEPAYLENKTIKDIAAGGSVSCAIASDDKAYCWGRNNNNELGANKDDYGVSVPVPVYSDGVLNNIPLESVYSGDTHSCAISTSGRAYCWGSNSYGSLGDGSESYSSTNIPVAVKTNGALSGKTIKSMALGNDITCVIASDYQAYCWGMNWSGELGIGTSDYETHSSPVAVDTSGVLNGKTIKQIAAGSYGSICVVASNEGIYCWGDDLLVPTAVDTSGLLSGKTIRQISVGYSNSCVITTDENIYCWGGNADGQLGDSTNNDSSVPVAVSLSGVLSGKSFSKIISFNDGSCVLSTEGKLYCWGANSGGIFGNGTYDNSNIPVVSAIAGDLAGREILDISASDNHICAVASDNQAYCWGNNNAGMLGDNTNTAAIGPKKVYARLSFSGQEIVDFSTYKDVTGYGSICVLSKSSKMFCWGDGNKGNNSLFPLGSKSRIISAPLEISMEGALSGKIVKRMESNLRHNSNCLIASDDNVYCWGSQEFGQLGNGVNGMEESPEQYYPVAVNRSGVMRGKAIKKVSGGAYFTCALSTDGYAYCWGANNDGQLGDGTTVDSAVPVSVVMDGILAGKTIKDIEAGDNHMCAIGSDDKVYCWGGNSYGALGDNSTSNKSVPVAVSTTGNISSSKVISISAGNGFSCATTSRGKAYCWGNNQSRQLGNGSNANSSIPTEISYSGDLNSKFISQISSSDVTSTILTSDGNYYSWGHPSWDR